MGRSIVGGIAGGVVGATVMSMILVASKVVMGMPLLADFVVMGTFVGGVGEAAIAAGFAAHYLVGFVVGGIFGALVVYVAWLKPTSGAKALSIGVVFGAVVWLIVFLPVAMWGFAPIMMGMMGACRFGDAAYGFGAWICGAFTLRCYCGSRHIRGRKALRH